MEAKEKEFKDYASEVATELIWYDEIPPMEDWKPGMAFHHGMALSDYYNAEVSKVRKPISILIPSRKVSDHNGVFLLCLDMFTTGYRYGSSTNDGYHVTVQGDFVAGQKPNITVAESLVCRGIYHGFLRRGVLDPDFGDCRDISEGSYYPSRRTPSRYY